MATFAKEAIDRDPLDEADPDAAASRLQKALRRRSFFHSTPSVSDLIKSEQPREEAVSTELAEGLLSHAQSVSSAFNGLNDDALHVLTQRLSVVRYAANETIMVEGEPGTWFGIVLSGALRAKITDGQYVPIKEGAIIGELAIWNKGSKRANTVMGADEPGIIAVMLVDDLRTFAVERPTAGALARLSPSSHFVHPSPRQRDAI